MGRAINFIYKTISIPYTYFSNRDERNGYDNTIIFLMVGMFFNVSTILIYFNKFEILFNYLPSNRLNRQLIVLISQVVPFYLLLRFGIKKDILIENAKKVREYKLLFLLQIIVFIWFILSFLLFILFAGSHK